MYTLSDIFNYNASELKQILQSNGHSTEYTIDDARKFIIINLFDNHMLDRKSMKIVSDARFY